MAVTALQQSLAEVLAWSTWTARTGEPAEEWIILDHEGLSGPPPGQHESFDRVVELAVWPDDNGGAQW